MGWRSLAIKERPDVLVNLGQPDDVIMSLCPEPATTEPEGKAARGFWSLRSACCEGRPRGLKIED
jgi:hypothetical protein